MEDLKKHKLVCNGMNKLTRINLIFFKNIIFTEFIGTQ